VSEVGEGSAGLGTVLGAVWRRDWDRVAVLTPRCPRRVALFATVVMSVGHSLPFVIRGSGLEWPRSGCCSGSWRSATTWGSRMTGPVTGPASAPAPPPLVLGRSSISQS
jgi:hypothetical protein